MILLIARIVAAVQEFERPFFKIFAFGDFVGCRTMGWIDRINQQVGDKYDK